MLKTRLIFEHSETASGKCVAAYHRGNALQNGGFAKPLLLNAFQTIIKKIVKPCQRSYLAFKTWREAPAKIASTYK
jgi:hypothetical protein